MSPTRHRRHRARTAALATVAALAAVAACTAPPADPSGPTPGAGTPDIARPVDVGGGRTVYLECHGSGTPTVVLLSGFGNAGDIWQEADAHPPSVAVGVAAFTRVCLYDRPGSYVVTVEQNGIRVEAPSADQYTPARGDAVASTTADGGTPVVAELHRLLSVAGVAPPYVLVGHSLGGLFAQLYARTYADQVTAMVLVDPPTPTLEDVLSPAAWASAWRPQLQPGPSLIPGYVNERYDVARVFDEITAAGPLPRIPVTYLSATVPPTLDRLPAGERASAAEVVDGVPAAAAAYVRSPPDARFVPVPGATHYIQTERPDVVIAAARDAAAGRPWTGDVTALPGR